MEEVEDYSTLTKQELEDELYQHREKQTALQLKKDDSKKSMTLRHLRRVIRKIEKNLANKLSEENSKEHDLKKLTASSEDRI